MTNLTEKVLKNIEQQNITPRPKWVFRLQDLAVWFSSAIFIMIGGFAFSVVIYMIKDSDWYVYQNMGSSLWGFLLLMLPYFWLIVLGILVAVANYNLKVTKKGYRFHLRTIVAFVMLASMIIGTALYYAGMGRAIDESFASRLPFYEEFVNKMNRDRRLWMRPEHGLLAGMVISVSEDGKMLVSDFNNDVWRVVSSDATILQGRALGNKQAVKIVGQQINDENAAMSGEKVFTAKLIQVMPDPAFLKRHPMGPPRVMEIGSGVMPDMTNQNSFMHMEYQDATTTSMEEVCGIDADCKLPFMFAVRSNCPFAAKCLDNNCAVTCEVGVKAGRVGCKKSSDCDCESYTAQDKIGCLCADEHCLIIVK